MLKTKTMIIIIFALLFSAAVGIFFYHTYFSNASKNVRYNEKINYKKEQSLVFPDFTLSFTGITEKKSDKIKFTFKYYNFIVKNSSEEKNFSWSPGTGDTAPADFEIGGKKYSFDVLAGIVNPLGDISSEQKNIETRDFSCPSMAGFTFKYPVFRGWETHILSESDTICHIYLNQDFMSQNLDTFKNAPQIQVEKIPHKDIGYSSLKNPNGINYFSLSGSRGYIFSPENFSVIVTLHNVRDVPPDDVFFKTVIESFKIL